MAGERTIEKTIVEKNLVFGLVRRTPIFVINGRIYYCVEEANPNTPNSRDELLKIKEGPKLEILERLSEKILQQDYADFQEKFLAKELELGEARYSGYTANHKKLVRFAVKEVFPYLRKENTKELDELLETSAQEKEAKEKPKDNEIEKEIESYAQNKIREIESKTACRINPKKTRREVRLNGILLNESLSKSVSSDSRLLEIMNGFNFGIYDEQVFTLSTVERGENISIGGKKYALVPAGDFSELKNDFIKEIINALSIEALRDKLKECKEFQKIKAERSDIDFLCKKDSYHEKDFGFQRNGELLTVYVEVPNYVLKSPQSDLLYRFDAHKLGIGISIRDNQIYLYSNPHSLSYVEGPFYGSGSDLCMGSYSNSYFNRMPQGKAFAKLLLDARNVVLRGYRYGISPRRYLNDDNYGSKRITLSEVEKRRLEITNNKYCKGGQNVR